MNERLHLLNARLDELIEFAEDTSGKVKAAAAGLSVGGGTVGIGTALYARGVRGALHAKVGRQDATSRLISKRGITGNIKAGAKLLPGDIKRHVVNPIGIGIGLAKIPAVRQAYSHDIKATVARKLERTARKIRR